MLAQPCADSSSASVLPQSAPDQKKPAVFKELRMFGSMVVEWYVIIASLIPGSSLSMVTIMVVASKSCWWVCVVLGNKVSSLGVGRRCVCFFILKVSHYAASMPFPAQAKLEGLRLNGGLLFMFLNLRGWCDLRSIQAVCMDEGSGLGRLGHMSASLRSSVPRWLVPCPGSSQLQATS